MPGALAVWMGPGGAEPDTRFDRDDGVMFPDPALDGRKVYLNGFLAVEGTSVNPNVAALGTRVLVPTTHARVMLGMWRDCDRDGYVGKAESALQEYPSALADTSVCPAGSIHNDGRFVSELIGIGMVDPCERASDAVRERDCPGVDAFHRNERVLYSTDTRVWADIGEPGAVPRAECVVAPLPRGTTGSTGALLRYADCQDGGLIVRTVGSVDPNAPSTIDVPLPVTLFGTPEGRPGVLEQESGDRAWTVFDCSSRERLQDPTGGYLSEVAVEDPTGGQLTGPVFPLVVVGATFDDDDNDDSTPGVFRRRVDADGQGTLFFVPNAAPSLHDPAGSHWDSAEAALDATRGDCDPSTASGTQGAWPGAAVESGDHLVPPARKDQPSLTFTFYDGHRGLHKNVDPTTGPSTPSDGGLLVLRHGRGGAGPMWSALTTTTQEPQLVRRGELDAAPAFYVAYYARIGRDVVSDASLTLPGTVGAYGTENCGAARTGVVQGWVCDPALWWRDEAGNDVRPRYAQGYPFGSVVGDLYDMRDVDCYDGRVAPVDGAHASLVLLTGPGPCP